MFSLVQTVVEVLYSSIIPFVLFRLTLSGYEKVMTYELKLHGLTHRLFIGQIFRVCLDESSPTKNGKVFPLRLIGCQCFYISSNRPEKSS